MPLINTFTADDVNNMRDAVRAETIAEERAATAKAFAELRRSVESIMEEFLMEKTLAPPENGGKL